MTQMNDGPTDEELNAAMAVMTDFAEKHLPEGYVIELLASAYGNTVSWLRTDEDGETEAVESDFSEWGKAVDGAIKDAQQQGRTMRGFIG